MEDDQDMMEDDQAYTRLRLITKRVLVHLKKMAKWIFVGHLPSYVGYLPFYTILVALDVAS